jgi:hypothetical protein
MILRTTVQTAYLLLLHVCLLASSAHRPHSCKPAMQW